MKIPYCKRVLTLVLVFALIGSMPVSVSANVSSSDTTNEETILSDVLNVIVPADIDFVIDPLELAGRGQVYSDVPPIVNQCAYDVQVSVTDIEVIFANENDFVPSAQSFASGINDREKRIYLELTLGEEIIVITDNDVDSLTTVMGSSGTANSALPIGISGNINPYSMKEWQDGDVKVRLLYQLEEIINPEEEVVNEEPESFDEDGDENAEDTADTEIVTAPPNISDEKQAQPEEDAVLSGPITDTEESNAADVNIETPKSEVT